MAKPIWKKCPQCGRSVGQDEQDEEYDSGKKLCEVCESETSNTRRQQRELRALLGMDSREPYLRYESLGAVEPMYQGGTVFVEGRRLLEEVIAERRSR